jgi:hypothetical protein
MSRRPTYPTPIQQAKHLNYLKTRAQAKLRGEAFDLTIEEYMTLWRDDLWVQRGRKSHSLSMTRLDPNGAWTRNNIVIINRVDQLRYVIAITTTRKQNAKKSIQ